MAAITDTPSDGLDGDPDAVIRQLYSHQTVLVETFYRGGTMATVARELGIPHGTARSRLHYALDALRKQFEERDPIAAC